MSFTFALKPLDQFHDICFLSALYPSAQTVFQGYDDQGTCHKGIIFSTRRGLCEKNCIHLHPERERRKLLFVMTVQFCFFHYSLLWQCKPDQSNSQCRLTHVEILISRKLYKYFVDWLFCHTSHLFSSGLTQILKEKV